MLTVLSHHTNKRMPHKTIQNIHHLFFVISLKGGKSEEFFILSRLSKYPLDQKI